MDKKRTPCKYGAKCYRKNKDHLQNFSHPSREGEDGPPTKKGKIDSFFKKDADKKTEEKKAVPPAASEPSGSGTNVRLHEDNDDERQPPEPNVDDLPDSPVSPHDLIQQKYQMEMPPDFYDFFTWCKELDNDNPCDAFRTSLGLQLVGPFDVLSGKHRSAKHRMSQKEFMLHWRFFYDPPEFMTVAHSVHTPGLHWGYFRDDPSEMPVFLGSNDASKDGVITQCAPNLFALLHCIAESVVSDGDGGKDSAQTLIKQLQSKSSKLGYSLSKISDDMKERNKKSVCKTFHKAGLVVPYDETTELGYRPVPETPAGLRKILEKIVTVHSGSASESDRLLSLEPLEELITLCQFANDECDYGEGLELGIDIFSVKQSNQSLTGPMMALLPIAYQLLSRPLYSDIISAHLADRTKNLQPSKIK